MITKAALKERIAQLKIERERVLATYSAVIGELEKLLSNNQDNTKEK